jgi:peptidoglycan hydrolase-like protein with peptidoglycan-binding domain
VQYFFGNFGPHIRQWQLQMRKRGYPFQGTGYFGTTTLKYVKILQQRNGLHVVGFIGPKTWAAAWTGR